MICDYYFPTSCHLAPRLACLLSNLALLIVGVKRFIVYIDFMIPLPMHYFWRFIFLGLSIILLQYLFAFHYFVAWGSHGWSELREFVLPFVFLVCLDFLSILFGLSQVLPYDTLMKELDVSNVRELEDFLINDCMYVVSPCFCSRLIISLNVTSLMRGTCNRQQNHPRQSV